MSSSNQGGFTSSVDDQQTVVGRPSLHHNLEVINMMKLKQKTYDRDIMKRFMTEAEQKTFQNEYEKAKMPKEWNFDQEQAFRNMLRYLAKKVGKGEWF